MKALVYSQPQQFAIMERENPVCGRNQVLIRVKSCGICKTDVHIHHGSFISKFPLIPGHEFAGVIKKLSNDVTGFKKGDRVVADNTVLCGECYFCRKDQPLYCENFYSLGVNGPGGFAEYVAVNQDKVFSISDRLSFDEAAFAEPTACAVHGMDMIDVKLGDDVLLFGSGPTGIILAQLLKSGGAGNIVVAAPTKFKLDLVAELGIGQTVQIDRNDPLIHEKRIKELCPRGFDIVIDATGAAPVVERCVKYAKRGAKIVIYGVCDEKEQIRLSPYEIFAKELKIIGSFAQTHCFDRALKYLENGLVKVNKLITHQFKLDDYGEALNAVISGKDSIKVIVNP
jgi:D-arabinitol dehydrogenase (NADP+)